MSIKIFSFLFLILAGLSNQAVYAQKKFKDADPATASVKEKGNFIELRDGRIIESNKLQHKAPSIGKERFVLDNGQEYPGEEVIAYQLDKIVKVYYRRFDDKYHFVARIITGNINVFHMHFGNEQQFYIQKGQKGVVKVLKAGSLQDMVEDYAPAYDLIKKLANYNIISKKLEESIVLYNAR